MLHGPSGPLLLGATAHFLQFLVMTFAILSALPEEQQGIAASLSNARTTDRAGRRFVQGQLWGHDVVCALSGIGKVAAATTTTMLIEHFGVQAVVFTGVAGGVGPGVHVGDVVVATQFVQHDMDARPLFERWLVPGYPSALFDSDPALRQGLEAAARSAVAEAATWQSPLLNGHRPQVHTGLIGSGDQFMHSAAVCTQLCHDLAGVGHTLLAVEMEGAAIAQTCADYGVPLAAVRTISDRADDQAHVDFPAFVTHVASRYAQHIITHWLQQQP